MNLMLTKEGRSVAPFLRGGGDGKGRNLRFTIGLVIALALVLGGAAPVQAGYAFPTTPTQMISSFEAFVSDFSSWNSSLNNQPLMELAAAPADQTTNVVLFLWLEWLQSGRDHSLAQSSPSSMQNANGSGNPFGPGSGNGVTGGSNIGGPISLGGSASPLGSPGQGGSGGGVSGEPVSGGQVTPNQAAAPEPASLTLLGTGLFGFLTYGYARRRAARRV